MKLEQCEISDYGDSGILVEFSKTFTKDAWHNAHYLAYQIKQQQAPEILGLIPTYSSVYIYFDCLVTDHATIKMLISEIMGQAVHSSQKSLESIQRFRIPVVFGGEWGPDLLDVAEQLGIPEDDVVHLFCSRPNQIRCLGSIGLPMMDAPPFGQKISRLETPRTRVPAGSVAVGGNQATIYTLESPGGWRLIGQSPVNFVDLGSDPPVPYNPGDHLEFFSIKEEDSKFYKGISIDEMRVKG